MLCIKDSTAISLQGYEGSSNYDYLILKVNKCSNSTPDSHVCKPQSQIDSFIQTKVNLTDFLKVRFFIVDTRITPGDQNPVTKVLEKKYSFLLQMSLGRKDLSVLLIIISRLTKVFYQSKRLPP